MSQQEEITNFGQYGKSFQEKIMQALLVDNTWAEQMMEVFNPEYFDQKYLTYLSDLYFKYWKKYRMFPTFQLLLTIVRDDLKTGVEADLRDLVVDYLKRMHTNPDPSDLPFVKDKSLDFCRRQALKDALVKAVDLIQTEKYESIVDVIRRAVVVGTVPSMGHDFFEDVEARFIARLRSCIPTGIPELDAKGVLNGGLGGGELGIVIGPSGAGKCTDRRSRISIRYVTIKIDGKCYKPWERVRTKRGNIHARDVVESDELV